MTFQEELQDILTSLSTLATEETKKRYLRQGIEEPLFGTPIGKMKPLSKRYMGRQDLANALFETGNYDAMYFAGVIADPLIMKKSNYYEWLEKAYCLSVSEHIISVTLAESPNAAEIALELMQCEQELYQCAGISCFEWLVGSKKDPLIHFDIIDQVLTYIVETIHTKPFRVQKTMNRTLIAIGVSYLPLHEKALEAAETIGIINTVVEGKSIPLESAKERILKEKDKGRLGFKRKAVRC